MSKRKSNCVWRIVLTANLPLTNPRHEVFVRERANGAPLALAWRAGTPAGTAMSDDSARSSGWRCQARPEVAARIEYLRAKEAVQRKSVGSAVSLTDKTPVDWMREICTVLRLTSEAFEHLPLQKRSKLKSVYAAHLARLHKMEGNQAPFVDPFDVNPILVNVKACTCP